MIPTTLLRFAAKLLELFATDATVDLTAILPNADERRTLVHAAIASEPQLAGHAFDPAATFDTWSGFYLARYISREISRRTMADQGAINPFAGTNRELFDYMGTNGLRWAEQCAARCGGDVSDLLGWFANAIETGKAAAYTAALEGARTTLAPYLGEKKAGELALDIANGVGEGTEFPNLTATPITATAPDGKVTHGIGIGRRDALSVRGENDSEPVEWDADEGEGLIRRSSEEETSAMTIARSTVRGVLADVRVDHVEPGAHGSIHVTVPEDQATAAADQIAGIMTAALQTGLPMGREVEALERVGFAAAIKALPKDFDLSDEQIARAESGRDREGGSDDDDLETFLNQESERIETRQSGIVHEADCSDPAEVEGFHNTCPDPTPPSDPRDVAERVEILTVAIETTLRTIVKGEMYDVRTAPDLLTDDEIPVLVAGVAFELGVGEDDVTAWRYGPDRTKLMIRALGVEVVR